MSRRQTIPYQPALDGVRALAVSAVLVFHAGITWMSGGYLGVSVFFTLSGYLITSLLLAEHRATGTVAAGAFYARRARRLLPASLVCLVAVAAAAAAGWFKGVSGLRRDFLGALFQVFNWVKLASGESYADLNASAAGLRKPLDHYWSLAIEEQFYWVWPLAFLGIVAWCARTGRRPRQVLTGLVVVFGIAAPVIAGVWGPDAAYWATPARMAEILVGAAVACWLADRPVPRRPAPPDPAGPAVAADRGDHRALVLGVACLVALAAACVLFPDGHGPAYQGALPLVALVSGLLIVGLQQPGPLVTALSWRPLVALGKISYGVYLFHWPIFVLIDRRRWDVPVGVSLAVKCAITLVVAVASYFAVERPVRRATRLVPRLTLVSAVAAMAVVAALVVVVPSVSKFYGVDAEAAQEASIGTGSVAPLVTLTSSTTSTTAGTTLPGAPTTQTATTAAVVGTAPAPTTTVPLVPPRPVRIVVVGDSTAEALGAGLVQWAAANPALAQVTVLAIPGCGLVPGGILDSVFGVRDVDAACGQYVPDQLVAKVGDLHPDVVVGMMTAWDLGDRRLVAGGPIYTLHDSQLVDYTAAALTRFADRLFAAGVSRVVWVQEPVPDSFWLHNGKGQDDPTLHESMHAILRGLAQADPAVRVADLAGWLDQQGLTEDRDSRPDGIHLAPAASEKVAAEFLGPALVREALT